MALKKEEIKNGLLVKVDFTDPFISNLIDGTYGKYLNQIGEVVKPVPKEQKDWAPNGYTIWFPAIDSYWAWAPDYLIKL